MDFKFYESAINKGIDLYLTFLLYYYLFELVFLFVISFDQITKLEIIEYFGLSGFKELIGNIFISYVLKNFFEKEINKQQ